jgi:hypothetical protein
MSDNTLPDPPEVPDAPSFYTGWTEPQSAANTTYANSQPVFPFNNVTQTASGHSFEMDDTLGRERVRLQHRSNTFVEMHPNGDMVQKIYGNGYTITLGDHNIAIGVENADVANKLNITVYGDVNMHVTGDFTQQIDGDYELFVQGDMSVTANGILGLTSAADTVIQAGGVLGGGIKLEGDQHIQGDFIVDGEVIAQKITSLTRVDALLGMSAGINGFVTETGGVMAGPGIAVPGQVNAAVSISSPAAIHGTTASLWSWDVINQALNNIHNHIAPNGPTSPTLDPEIG